MQFSVRCRDTTNAQPYLRTNRSLGFSFSGEVREPFPAVIKAMEQTQLPVTSVDAPSSWNIEEGPPKSGLGSTFHPTALISLTAPKPLVKFFKGRHFIGGRCVPLDNLLQAASKRNPGSWRRLLRRSTNSRCQSMMASIKSLRSALAGRSCERSPGLILAIVVRTGVDTGLTPSFN